MAIALVTLVWCDKHLTEKDEEVPATAMPEMAGYNVDLCEECAEPVLATLALYEQLGSKGDRTPKAPKSIRAAAAKAAAATGTMADRDKPAIGTTRQGKPALYQCPVEDCGAMAASRQSLASHARNQHGRTLAELEGKPLPHKCPEPGCGRGFTSPQGLALHSRGHLQSAAS